jgi:glycosyltransferase involved in cell wall biosynthesis
MNANEINVLHLLNGEQYSGLERVVDLLADLAPDYGYRFHFLFLKPGEGVQYIKTKKAYFHFVPMRFKADFFIIYRIQKLVTENNIRLIHSHTVRSAIVARLLKIRLALPWCHHVHSPARYESENQIRNYINSTVEHFVLPKANQLIPVSKALSDYIHDEYQISKDKMTVIHNGVPNASVCDSVEKSPDASEAIIGMLGLFRPRKGLETLLQALQTLILQGIRIKLRLIGGFVTSEYTQSVQRLAKNLGLSPYIQYVGFQTNVTSELMALDVLIIPSLYGEGLPMALLEAMALRRVVVASAVDGILEVLSGQECGVLAPPGDANALTWAIKSVVLNRKYSAKLAAAAQFRQKSVYSLDQMANGMFSLYKHYLTC